MAALYSPSRKSTTLLFFQVLEREDPDRLKQAMLAMAEVFVSTKVFLVVPMYIGMLKKNEGVH